MIRYPPAVMHCNYIRNALVTRRQTDVARQPLNAMKVNNIGHEIVEIGLKAFPYQRIRNQKVDIGVNLRADGID